MFFNNEEQIVSKDFLSNGFIVKKIKDIKSLNFISNLVTKKSSQLINKNKKNNFLDNFHQYTKVKDLNKIRLNLYRSLNMTKNFREHYYNLSKHYLDILVGNELVMQNKVNLSIQLPGDNSSLLPLHSDTWSGDSPFEIVVWLPLVDCYKTKSMYILKPSSAAKLYANFTKNNKLDSDKIFNKIKKDLTWIDIKYGEVLIFNQSLPHGNVVNKEAETRWSLNCRFKSLFSPYGDKKLGEFFEPITIKVATQIGLNYKSPE